MTLFKAVVKESSYSENAAQVLHSCVYDSKNLHYQRSDQHRILTIVICNMYTKLKEKSRQQFNQNSWESRRLLTFILCAQEFLLSYLPNMYTPVVETLVCLIQLMQDPNELYVTNR